MRAPLRSLGIAAKGSGSPARAGDKGRRPHDSFRTCSGESGSRHVARDADRRRCIKQTAFRRSGEFRGDCECSGTRPSMQVNDVCRPRGGDAATHAPRADRAKNVYSSAVVAIRVNARLLDALDLSRRHSGMTSTLSSRRGLSLAARRTQDSTPCASNARWRFGIATAAPPASTEVEK